eukprot:842849_1
MMGNRQKLKPKSCDEYDSILAKCVLIGDEMVGKSAMVDFIDHGSARSSKYIPTIGVDIKVKTFTISKNINNIKFAKMQIWDTAGQVRFRNIIPAYLTGASGIIFCYDTTSDKSFESMKQWIDDDAILARTDKSIIKILVGTKHDLFDKREVSWQKGKELAHTLSIPFFETSVHCDEMENMNLAIEDERVVYGYIRMQRQLLPNITMYNIPQLVITFCLEYCLMAKCIPINTIFDTLVELIAQSGLHAEH